MMIAAATGSTGCIQPTVMSNWREWPGLICELGKPCSALQYFVPPDSFKHRVSRPALAPLASGPVSPTSKPHMQDIHSVESSIPPLRGAATIISNVTAMVIASPSFNI